MAKSIKRNFFPGSEWVFFKLYLGTKNADIILSNELLKFATNLKRRNIIDKWFFIRYSDPEFHLRVRFHVVKIEDVCEVINCFYMSFGKVINNYNIWKIQIDTYKREIERYNEFLIEEFESLFFINSECVIEIINKTRSLGVEDSRWIFALYMIDSVLNSFYLSIENRYLLLSNISSAFKIEFGFNLYNSKQFNTKYRINKNEIESVLSNECDDEIKLKIFKIIDNYSNKSSDIVSRILHLSNVHEIDFANILPSFIHMIQNRIFISNNRLYEVVIYDFLKRYYNSKLVRSIQINNKSKIK